jgi:hypothetical protein
MLSLRIVVAPFEGVLHVGELAQPLDVGEDGLGLDLDDGDFALCHGIHLGVEGGEWELPGNRGPRKAREGGSPEAPPGARTVEERRRRIHWVFFKTRSTSSSIGMHPRKAIRVG